MPFKPGHRKYGGRKAGAVNKRTDLFQKCDARGIDVFDEMLSIALTTTDATIRFGMLRDIAGWLYAKKKEVLNLNDHSADELLAVAEQKIAEIESIDDPAASET